MPTHLFSSARLRGLISSVTVCVATLWAPASQAGTVLQPASIVDHGSYITDTVNNRDWYKFSNPVNTIAVSMQDWLASGNLAGWSVASAVQVKGLEAQFGWTGDTPNQGHNANEGLTNAMAAYLGLTGVSHSNGQDVQHIDAMTSDLFIAFNNATQQFDLQYQQLTTSQFFTEHVFANGAPGVLFYGDYVDSNYGLLPSTSVDLQTGIWLSRAGSGTGGGGSGNGGSVTCGTLAPCVPGVDVPGNDVHEPGSLPLLALGLVALAWRVRRQRPRQVV